MKAGRDSGPDIGKPSKSSFRRVRSRAARACEVCHTRKVRCDVVSQQPCTNCVAFGCECRVPESRNRHSSPNSVSAVAPQTGSKRPADSPEEKYTPPGPKRRDSQGAFLGSSSHASLILQPDLDPNGEAVHFAKLPHGYGSNNGEANPLLTPTEFEKAMSGQIDRLKDAHTLPPKILCDELIDDYFRYIHPALPILDKEAFLRGYRSPRAEDQPSLLLKQAMFCAACRICKNKSVQDSQGSTRAFCTTIYLRGKALFDADYESDPLVNIAAASLFALTIDRPSLIKHNIYYWTRIAVILAQGIGLHRRVSSETLPRNLVSLRKRVWWALYIREVSAAVAYGRPMMIQLEDCDVDMVTPEDFFDDREDLDYQFFIYTVKLHEIMAVVARTQYSVRAERLRHLDQLPDATQCDIALAQWANNLPEVLRYSIKDRRRYQYFRALLYLKYYTVLCLAHRPQVVHYSHPNQRQRKYPTWGIAFQAAHMIVRILENMRQRDEIRRLPSSSVHTCLSAMIMLFYQAQSSTPEIAAVAQEAINNLSITLKEFRQTAETAEWVLLLCKSLGQNNRFGGKFAKALHSGASSSIGDIGQALHAENGHSPTPATEAESQHASEDVTPAQPVHLATTIDDPPPETPTGVFKPEALFPEEDQASHEKHPLGQLMSTIGELPPPSPSGDESSVPATLDMGEWYDFLVSNVPAPSDTTSAW